MMGSNIKIFGLAVLLVIVTAISSYGIMKGSTGSPISSSDLTPKDVERIVRNYIEENPKQIIDSLTSYQMQEEQQRAQKAKEKVVEKRDDLENNPNDPIAGNPNGDVTIVEFFDYSCGYCKRAFSELAKILDEDPNIKIVLKEFPILGPNSVLAAKAAVAVHIAQPDKYWDFHAALMKGRTSGKEAILKQVADLGMDKTKISKLMDSEDVQKVLSTNRALANEIGVRGTPAFIINGHFSPGALGYSDFKQIIASQRKE